MLRKLILSLKKKDIYGFYKEDDFGKLVLVYKEEVPKEILELKTRDYTKFKKHNVFEKCFCPTCVRIRREQNGGNCKAS